LGDEWRLCVDVFSVPDVGHVDKPFSVVDAINDPVIADPDPPEIGRTNNLLHTGRSWSRRQGIDGLHRPLLDDPRQCMQVALSRAREDDPIVSHGMR